MKTATAVIVILIYTLVGTYFGGGSITRVNIEDKVAKIDAKKDSLSRQLPQFQYGTEKYASEYDLEYDLATSDMNNFKLIKKLNNLQATIVAAASFGLLGAVIALILAMVSSNIKLTELKVWSQPFLGALSGLVIVALVYLMPTLLVKNGGEARPYTLMFISLICGIYNKEFYTFLHHTFVHKILKNEKNEKA